MPIGSNLTHCMHCGKDFICGDCITFTCFECGKAGHTENWDCAKCKQEHEDHMLKLANLQSSKDE